MGRDGLSGRASQQLAVRADFVGFGVHLYLGGGRVVDQIGFADVAGVLHGDGLFTQAKAVAQPARLRGFRNKGHRTMLERTAIGPEHRAGIDRLRRWDRRIRITHLRHDDHA